MEKKIVSGIMLTLLFICMLTLAFNIQPVRAEPRTWTVDDDGPADFHTIQGAINAANPEDTIFVRAGSYYEHVVVNKAVSLIGDKPAITIIDGSGTGIVVKIEAANVTIRGFTIQNGRNTTIDCGIYVKNHTVKISNNIVRNNYNGIWLQRSNGSSIIDNKIWNNTWAVRISESNKSVIHGNTIANNSIGVWITSSSAVLNTFYHNNFIGNLNQASDFGNGTIWDNGYPSGGNYWSDHNPPDLYSGPYQNETGRDGIGDTAYFMYYNVDWYPLVYPYVYVTSPDVNDDGIVDIADLRICARAYGSMAVDDPDTPWDESENWDPNVDLNNDGIINIFDLRMIAKHYLEQV